MRTLPHGSGGPPLPGGSVVHIEGSTEDFAVMEAYAVVETGGKQYRVSAGQSLEIERLDAEVGQDVEVPAVLAVSDGSDLKVGTPRVDGARVVFTVVAHTRGEKVINFKKRRRKGYERKVGHRQELTVVKVKSVG
jgi:large subunit ribosomal protein L21